MKHETPEEPRSFTGCCCFACDGGSEGSWLYQG